MNGPEPRFPTPLHEILLDVGSVVRGSGLDEMAVFSAARISSPFYPECRGPHAFGNHFSMCTTCARCVSSETKPDPRTDASDVGEKPHPPAETAYICVPGATRAEIDTAVAETQRILQTCIFPEMKVNWQTHSDNIGHSYFQGCFRCHDGEHRSAGGRVIRNDCALCHTTLDQTPDGTTTLAIDGEF
jgi:hypothetical protein